jgi:hypothetical protein
MRVPKILTQIDANKTGPSALNLEFFREVPPRILKTHVVFSCHATLIRMLGL